MAYSMRFPEPRNDLPGARLPTENCSRKTSHHKTRLMMKTTRIAQSPDDIAGTRSKVVGVVELQPYRAL